VEARVLTHTTKEIIERLEKLKLTYWNAGLDMEKELNRWIEVMQEQGEKYNI
jgi:hypothetical protein